MPESVSFVWSKTPFTVTRKEYDEGRYDARLDTFMTSEDFDRLWFVSQGRKPGPSDTDVPFFKRWHNMWGEAAGIEFRPFRRSDYGYVDDGTVVRAWVNWALQTAGNFSIGTRKAFIVLFGAMLFNDYLLDKIIGVGNGASFVYNVQMGVNLYQSLFRKAQLVTQIAAIYGSLGVVIGAPLTEMYEGYDFGESTSHKAHYLGAGMGIVVGMLLKNL